jgi:hypothetical protein
LDAVAARHAPYREHGPYPPPGTWTGALPSVNVDFTNGAAVRSEESLGRWLTFGVAVIGMAVVLVAFLVAVFVFRNAHKPAVVIVAILGPITTAVGTLAGFVAGAKVGSEGRDKAEDRADEAQRKYNAVVETNSPSIVDQARSKYPDLFK